MITYKTLMGKDLAPYLETISKMRIEEFKNYPYLYEGNLEYEMDYLRGYLDEEKSLLSLAIVKNNIIGIATALPLNTKTSILKEAGDLFLKNGLDPKLFFYFSEFIVLKHFRGVGIAYKMENDLVEIAKKWNFTHACIATVFREENDPRQPLSYKKSGHVWKSMGYIKTNMTINYQWPMGQTDGKIQDCWNSMEFWIKKID